MITREKNSVNQKNEKIYTVTDYTNYYFSSNHADALPIGEEDRRFFIIRAPDAKLEESFYAELDAQLRTGPLAQHILHYLLNKVDISTFNPKASALRTDYREEVIHGSFSFVDEFAHRLAIDPESVVRRYDITRSLVSAESLLTSFYDHYPRAAQTTAIGLGRALNRHRDKIPKREVRTSGTSPKYTLYALFDRDVWNAKTGKDWAQYHEVTLQGKQA
jgi:hypothetical protein